jgi:uncharacterized protein (DUF3084 family)
MTSAYVLIVAVLVLGGLLAALGDRLGSRVGKARLKLFNLRPKQTAVVVTIITGTLISASTLGILFATSKSLRQGVFRLDEILEKRREALRELQEVRTDKAEIEQEKEQVNRELSRVSRDKNRAEAQLESAKEEQGEVARRLEVMNQDFQEAKRQLRTVSQQASELRGEIRNLAQEKQQLQNQREQLTSQIGELQRQVQQRDRELTRRDQTIAQREQEIAAQERMLREQTEIITQQTEAIEQGQEQLANLEATLEREIAKRDRAIDQLDGEIAQKDQTLAQREARLQDLEATLEAEISRRDQIINDLDTQIAVRDRALAQRENRLTDLEQQLTFLKREVSVLEQYYQNYQALRQGNVTLVRGQVLASAAIRIGEETPNQEMVDELLRQANQSAIEAIRTPDSNGKERVVAITQAQVEQLLEQLQTEGEYVVRILTAENYLRGEETVRVFADVAQNQKIFDAGDTIATVSIEPEQMTTEELQQRLDLLLAASQFHARRAGIIGDIQVGDGDIVTLIRFIEQLNESDLPLDQIKAIASENAETIGGLKLRLVAMQKGQVIFGTS